MCDLEVRLSNEIIYQLPENDLTHNRKRQTGGTPKRKTQNNTAPRFTLVVKNNGLLPVSIVGITSSPASCVFLPALQKVVKQERTEGKPRRRAAAQMLQLAPGETREIEGHFHLAKLQRAMRDFAQKPEMLSFPEVSTAAPAKSDAAPAASTSSATQAPAFSLSEDTREPAQEHEGEALPSGLRLRLQLQLAPAWQAPACELTVLPPPEFELLTPVLHLQPMDETEAEVTPCVPLAGLRLRAGGAHVLRVESTSAAVHLAALAHDGLPPEAQMNRTGEVLQFRVGVARTALAAYRKQSRPLHTDLKIVCQGPRGIFRKRLGPLQIVPRVPAILSFPDCAHNAANGEFELNTWALQGRMRDLPVRVKNEGEEPLEIYAVEATPELEHLMRKGPALPVQVRPQETATFAFMLDMRGTDVTDNLQGLVAFRFRSGAESRERTVQFALHVVVRSPLAFPGFAALDFGASASCLAVSRSEPHGDSAAHLLEIQGQVLVPTTIFYHRVEREGERVYDIGQAAAEQARGASALLLLQDFKKTLQLEVPHPVLTAQSASPVTLTHGVLAADYLQALLRAAEDRIAADAFLRGQDADFGACLLPELTVVCPATFTFQQKDALRHALSELDVEVKAESFQSTAAMACFSELPQIVAWYGTAPAGKAAASARSGYVLVYDLGACFTDLALVQFDFGTVTAQKIDGRDAGNVRVRIAGVDGDDQFGGQSVTAALAKYFAQRIVALLERKLKMRPQVPLWYHAGTTPAKKIEQIGWLNWKHLLQYAEEQKQRLVAGAPSSAHAGSPGLTLSVLAGEKLQAVRIDRLALPADFLAQIISTRLALHLRKMKKLMSQAGTESPDFVYLTGRSAVLPEVRKIIGNAFGCRVIFAGELRAAAAGAAAEKPPAPLDLKASAALGGVQFARLQQSGGIFSKR